MKSLATKQIQILEMIVSGLRDGEVAERLGMTRSGVQWHLLQIQATLGTASRGQMIYQFANLKLTGQLISSVLPLGKV